MIDCNEWKTEKHHECANMGKENDTYYDGNCTERHCLSGTYEISPRWIFVRLSVHLPKRPILGRTYFPYREGSKFVPMKKMFPYATHFQNY